jgi:DNA-binding NtrC family response regulator
LLANATGTVLIVGESGTGKELVAEATHRLSTRRGRPFIPVNCAALPPELIESELFGHERGSFTGSRDASVGLLRAAGEGTIFLDEVTEMPIALQPKLLRALEQRRVRPVGGVREVPFAARVVAATNRDPVAAVQAGRLRADLFYRLCVHRLDLPPLRSLVEDVPMLVSHFLRELASDGSVVPLGFGQDALDVLSGYDFPGNVRELRNIVEHVTAVCPDDLVRAEHLPGFVQAALDEASRAFELSAPAGSFPALAEVETLHIKRALQLTQGNKTHAARLLGVSRHQLYIRLQRLGLED